MCSFFLAALSSPRAVTFGVPLQTAKGASLSSSLAQSSSGSLRLALGSVSPSPWQSYCGSLLDSSMAFQAQSRLCFQNHLMTKIRCSSCFMNLSHFLFLSLSLCLSVCMCVSMGVPHSTLSSQLYLSLPSPPPLLSMQALSIAVFSTGWGMGMVMGPAVGGTYARTAQPTPQAPPSRHGCEVPCLPVVVYTWLCAHCMW